MTDKIANPAIGAPGTLDACSTELKNISTINPSLQKSKSLVRVLTRSLPAVCSREALTADRNTDSVAGQTNAGALSF